MKSVSAGIVWALGLCLVGGCVSPQGVTLYQKMQRKAGKVNSHGGLAAVGVGSSKDLSNATKMAMMRGRTEVADSLQTRVNALTKDFRDQIGDTPESAEYNMLFSTAAKQLTSQLVQGIAAQEVETETKGDTVSVYALMVQNPKAIKEYFANVKNTPALLYERFRATQAFNQLDKDIQRYEEFLKQDAATPAP